MTGPVRVVVVVQPQLSGAAAGVDHADVRELVGVDLEEAAAGAETPSEGEQRLVVGPRWILPAPAELGERDEGTERVGIKADDVLGPPGRACRVMGQVALARKVDFGPGQHRVPTGVQSAVAAQRFEQR